MGDFAVAYGGDVAAGDQELHDLGAFAGELGPARRGCGILPRARMRCPAKSKSTWASLFLAVRWMG
jgi:hypothetical protein